MSHALCPNCHGPSIEVRATIPVSYQVSYDRAANDLMITSEEQGDVDWDGQTPVVCPHCRWQGFFDELVPSPER